jgi:site-specific DNA recombinase
MKAVGYIRVSTEEQKRSGWNLDADRTRIAEIAVEQGWDLIEVYDDGGLQGDDPDRPGFNSMLDALPDVDVIVMRSLDRLSRDTFLYALATKAIRDAGVKVWTFNGPVDLDTPEGELSANVLAAINRFEKRQIAARVKQAMGARARAGLPNGGPRPFGYLWGGEKGQLVVDPAEAAVVKRIYSDYLAGKGQRQIARDLNAEGVPPLHGGTWHQGTITRYLSNPLYAGRIRHRDDVHEGQHEAIIDLATWDKADQLRRSLRRTSGKNTGRYPTGSHLFRKGHLRCGRCGEAMIPVTKPTHTPGRLYEVYACYGRIRHGTDTGYCSQTPIQRHLIDTAVWEFFERVALDVEATKQAVTERSSAKLAEIDALRDQADRDLARAEDRLTRVRRAFQDGKLDADDWREQRAELMADLEAAKAQVQRLQAQA